MMQSSQYFEGKAEGEVKGRVEGRIEEAREFCSALARKYHAAVFDRIEGIIAACTDPARLKEWGLAASGLEDAEFLNLLGDPSLMVRDRHRMWELETSLYKEGFAAGLEEAGRLKVGRKFCAAIAQKCHPAVFERVEGVIAACDDRARLMEWTLAGSGSELSDAEFLKLVGA